MTKFDRFRGVRARALTSAIAGLAAVGALAGTAAAQTVELRMATLAPSGSRWEKTLTEGGSQIKDATEGRVVVTYFPDAGQGDERDYIRKIGQGQLDGAAVTSVGLAMIDPSIRVLELPRMFESEAEVDYVSGKMWKYFQKKFAKKGYELGDRGDVGWVYFLSKKKVATLADLKSQTLWRWGDDKLVETMYSKLGISGSVALGVPEVEGNLGNNTITACYGPPLASVTLGWASKVKYMTSMPMSFAIGATVIKTDSFKKLSADDQKKVKKISKKIAGKLKKNVRKDNAKALKEMKRKGVTSVEVDKAMVEAFDKAAQETWKALVGQIYTQAELDMVLKYRDEYRAKKGK